MTIFIERFVLAILAALVVLIAVTNPMGFGVLARIIGVIIIFVLAAILAHFSSQIIAGKRPRPVSTEDRVFVNMTPRDLTKIYLSNTDVQAQRLLEVYVNKWIRVSGRVANTRDSSYGGEITSVSVTLQPSRMLLAMSVILFNFPTLVFLYFDPRWRDRLIVLKRGHRLTVDGRIDQVDALGLRLKDCEIVD